MNDLIKDLVHRFENPCDEDDFIDTLKDVTFEQIEHLDREVLVRFVCVKYLCFESSKNTVVLR